MQCLLAGMKIRCCLFSWVHINFPPCLHSSTGNKSISKKKSTVCFASSPCKCLFSVHATTQQIFHSGDVTGLRMVLLFPCPPCSLPTHQGCQSSLQLGGHLHPASRTTRVFPWQPHCPSSSICKKNKPDKPRKNSLVWQAPSPEKEKFSGQHRVMRALTSEQVINNNPKPLQHREDPCENMIQA